MAKFRLSRRSDAESVKLSVKRLDEAEAVLARLKAAPDIPPAAHVDGTHVTESIRRALAAARFEYTTGKMLNLRGLGGAARDGGAIRL